MEPALLMTWTLQKEIEIPPDVVPRLVDGERPVAAYKTFRDSVKVKLAKDVDVRRLDSIIAWAVLGTS